MRSDDGHDDAPLRAAFDELRQAEEGGAPTFAQLLVRVRRPHLRRTSVERRARAAPSGLHRLVPRIAGAAAVVVAGSVGVWLGRFSDGARPDTAGAYVAVSLATWKAPTDFLLDTPGVELLRTTPEIPGPLPETLALAKPYLPTGVTR